MKKNHTYFVSWIVPNAIQTHIGNGTFTTKATGVQLVQDAINSAQTVHPEAIVLNICKLD